MRALVCVALLLVSAVAMAGDRVGLRGFGQWSALRDDGLFALPGDYRAVDDSAGLGEVTLHHSGRLVVDWSGRVQRSNGEDLAQGRLNELYTDFSAGALDFTVGKKVVNSSIGFGFRPLDLIEREDRRRLGNPPLEGVPLLAMEHIDADTADSIYLVNRIGGDSSGLYRAPHSEALLRHYRLWGEWETVAVGYLDEQRGGALGGGFTWVHGEGLEVHGAALWQPRLARMQRSGPVLATSDPWVEGEVRNDGRLLLGVQWTGASGISVLAEAWHDGSAMTRSQWQDLFKLAGAQRALLGTAPDAAVYGNLAWDLEAYQRPTVLADNLLLHLSYDGEYTDPYLDLLGTPADGGWVLTAGLDHQLVQGVNLAVGGRRFGGPSGSVYVESPLRSEAFIEVRGEMVW